MDGGGKYTCNQYTTYSIVKFQNSKGNGHILNPARKNVGKMQKKLGMTPGCL